MTGSFRLVMLSAMYENGGNVTHRLLDGHPEMFVYPFESQLGTRLVNDALTSMFPVKYRWPAFALDATPDEDYGAIIDEEFKVRTRTPGVSKFRDHAFDCSDDDRRARYVEYVSASARSRGGNVEALFRATFDAWRDRRGTGRESVYVGYSPNVVVDAEKILLDLPGAHVIHVVRNPWSAYADSLKRPVPLSLAHTMLAWTVNQYHALSCRTRFPDRVHVLRLEDVLADPCSVLGDVCGRLGLERSATLARPTWNGTELDEVCPWGTIRQATGEANRAAADELSPEDQAQIGWRAGPYLDLLDYRRFLTRSRRG